MLLVRKGEGMTSRKPKITIIHIGRNVPKGFIELPGGIHLGKGIWILPCELICHLGGKRNDRA